MKRIFLTLIAAAAMMTMVSCGPTSYTLGVEMRRPSDSGLDLGGKDIAVMYLDGEDTTSLESRFNKSFAEGLSLSVSDANSNSEEVFVYRLPQKAGVNYSSRDSLISLVLTVDADVVFLLEPADLPLAVQRGRAGTCRTALHAYDTMDSKDKVWYFGGNTYLDKGINEKNVVRKAEAAGRRFADSFRPNWELVELPVLYYESENWRQAVQHAYDYKWKEAMELWMDCLKTDNLLKRSSASYNIALACYIVGDYELALEWLDASDKDCKLSINDPLRARIGKALKK